MPLALPIVSKFDPRGINDARSGLDSLHNFAKTAGAMLAGAFTAAAVGVGAAGYAADTIQSVLRRRAAQQAANLIASGQGLPTQPNLAYRGLFTTGLVPPEAQ